MKAKPLFSTMAFTVAIRIQNREKVVNFINSYSEVISIKTFESNGYAEVVIKFEADIHKAVDIADYVNKVEQEVIDSGGANSWENYSLKS